MSTIEIDTLPEVHEPPVNDKPKRGESAEAVLAALRNGDVLDAQTAATRFGVNLSYLGVYIHKLESKGFRFKTGKIEHTGASGKKRKLTTFKLLSEGKRKPRAKVEEPKGAVVTDRPALPALGDSVTVTFLYLDPKGGVRIGIRDDAGQSWETSLLSVAHG